VNPTLLALAGMGGAVLIGVATAVRPTAALAFVVAIVFVPVVVLDLPLSLALYAPVPSLRSFDWVWIGPTVAGLLVFTAWLVSLRRGSPATEALGRHRRLLASMVALALWLTFSAIWAADAGAVGEMLVPWISTLLLAAVVFSTLRTGRHVELVLYGVIAGSVVSVLLGLASTGLTPDASVYQSDPLLEGRLAGGSGDPNYLAAGLVPAMVLTAGLATLARTLFARWAAIITIGILGIGLGAAQSRGGFVGVAVAVVVGLLVMRRHRRQVLAFSAILLAVAGFYMAATPGALERITNTDGGGTGRSDLWKVAGRIVGEHPVVGVGLNNFSNEAASFVRRPGELTYVRMIVDDPHVVHNSYLELLVETGAVGLGLYLAVVFGFIACTRRAYKAFERRGDRLASLARALFVAQVAALFPLFFVSLGYDMRFWLLLGLGPALLAVARRTA
jgi:O-antigen ligase